MAQVRGPWDIRKPLPTAETLAAPADLRHVVVHRADAAFGFLHDNALAWHEGELVAAWYNCPRGEMEGASCIRARRSRDGGLTWSAPEVVAADTTGQGILFVPVSLYSNQRRLLAFITRMTGADLVLDCESYVWHAGPRVWERQNTIAGPFIANTAPVPLANGGFVMGGRMADRPGTKPEIPAVALSDGRDLAAPWRLVPVVQSPLVPFEPFPETALWVNGLRVTALIRGGFVCSSRDGGETWSNPYRANLPQESSKLHAGTLSTGQRYLLWNLPDAAAGRRRNLLALAVGEPGANVLSKVWLIRRGPDNREGIGPEWSYPCAFEHDHHLFIVYSSEKRHSALSIVPLISLR
jgi:predicted neuraminidase